MWFQWNTFLDLCWKLMLNLYSNERDLIIWTSSTLLTKERSGRGRACSPDLEPSKEIFGFVSTDDYLRVDQMEISWLLTLQDLSSAYQRHWNLQFKLHLSKLIKAAIVSLIQSSKISISSAEAHLCIDFLLPPRTSRPSFLWAQGNLVWLIKRKNEIVNV
jgi:hypothetical protein